MIKDIIFGKRTVYYTQSFDLGADAEDAGIRIAYRGCLCSFRQRLGVTINVEMAFATTFCYVAVFLIKLGLLKCGAEQFM